MSGQQFIATIATSLTASEDHSMETSKFGVNVMLAQVALLLQVTEEEE